MGIAAYKVERAAEGWVVVHDGRTEGSYVTKEAAFEAIVGAASNSIREGHEVTITIPGGRAGEPALGARTN